MFNLTARQYLTGVP